MPYRVPHQVPYRVRVPAELRDHVRLHVADIAKEIVTAVRRRIPAYARPLDATYTHALQRGAEQALDGLLARMAAADADTGPVMTTYRRLGHAEADEGRGLESLHAAIRVGTQVVWRRMNAPEIMGPLPREAVAAFGELLFLQLDELSRAATTGHEEVRLRSAGELRRRRAHLVTLLTSSPPVSLRALDARARAAQWRLPQRLAVVVAELDHEPSQEPGAGRRGPMMPPGFLTRFEGRRGLIVVPDPDSAGRRRDVASALRGTRAAMGPAVALTEGARSLGWAVDALDLARRGVLPSSGLLRCADHLTTLLLLRDDALVDALAERCLLPLRDVRSPQRERLAETLLCWLQSGNSTTEVAERLAVHPQTVRYRMRQLKAAYGDRLSSHEERFALQLALQAVRLRGQAGPEVPAAAPVTGPVPPPRPHRRPVPARRGAAG
ncbi:PucR family transcriptional regulator [Streptomyces sp. NPDC054796]